MKFEDLYYDEITMATYRELLRVGKWFNERVGHHPLLIGGWAVYFYNPTGLGSRDVDVLFPDRGIKDRLVNQYLLTHGYERRRRSEFEEEYVLPANTSKGVESIYLDVATVQDSNRVHGSNVEIPWRLAFRHQIPAKIGGADFYVPRPEVLLLYKTKAALDREYDAKRAFDPFYLQQKRWKDLYDSASLLKVCDIDEAFLASLVDSQGFRYETVVSAFSVLLPPEVVMECVEQGKQGGHADALKVEENIKGGRIWVRDTRRSGHAEAIVRDLRLKGGEADVVRLYISGGVDVAVSDDRRFLQVLQALDIPFATTSSLIVALAKRGRMRREDARTHLQKLAEYISEEQYGEARAAIEELVHERSP